MCLLSTTWSVSLITCLSYLFFCVHDVIFFSFHVLLLKIKYNSSYFFAYTNQNPKRITCRNKNPNCSRLNRVLPLVVFPYSIIPGYATAHRHGVLKFLLVSFLILSLVLFSQTTGTFSFSFFLSFGILLMICLKSLFFCDNNFDYVMVTFDVDTNVDSSSLYDFGDHVKLIRIVLSHVVILATDAKLSSMSLLPPLKEVSLLFHRYSLSFLKCC